MSKEKQPSELDRRMSEMVINDKGNQNVQKKPDNEDKDKDKDKKERKDVKCIDKVLTEICENFIRDINNFGISVLDGFLGQERGDLVLEEVLQLHESGRFQEGQLVRNNTTNNSIRGDEILWLRGNEDEYPNIRRLINDIDRVVIAASKFPNNGKLGNYRIGSRTKVMVACYPGNGAQYVKHVDNPNVDARIITAIYYLNKNWDRKTHGGMLRIFPTDERTQAADIDPKFDRMLFFWSDRRNPHEVQPSFRTRYAITIWYYDANQEEALKRRRLEQATNEDQKLKVESS